MSSFSSVFSFVLVCFAVLCTESIQNITISTSLGNITGTEETNFIAFKGIQFTQNIPIGNNRFRSSTVKNTSYDNQPYDATFYRSACIQSPSFLLTVPVSEDCLYLNIWTPNIDSSLPVMLFIHGGAFTSGSGVTYTGDAFMKSQDVVYVSINYRLGTLGYLSLESISNETNGKTTGALNGVYDQIVALQWVQNNIADFGGDPNEVTIFGESAGSMAICMILISPLAQNLFIKAIMQSGSCVNYSPGSVEYGLEYSALRISQNNLNVSDPLNVDQLRTLDAETIYNLSIGVTGIDGWVLSQEPYDVYINQVATNQLDINAEKVIIGANSMDTLYAWPYLSPSQLPQNRREFKYFLRSYIANETQVQMLMDAFYINDGFIEEFEYMDRTFNSFELAWLTINADVCFICPSINTASILNDNDAMKNSTYLYLFYGPEFPYYVPHGAELVYLFNRSDIDTYLLFAIEKSRSISEFMIDQWREFAVYGSLLDSWMPFNDESNGVGMHFIDDNGYIQEDFIGNYRSGVCTFWFKEVDNVSQMCSLDLTVNVPKKKDNETIETLEIILIIAGGVVLLIVIVIVMFKMNELCFSKSDDKDGLSEMGQYGSVADAE